MGEDLPGEVLARLATVLLSLRPLASAIDERPVTVDPEVLASVERLRLALVTEHLELPSFGPRPAGAKVTAFQQLIDERLRSVGGARTPAAGVGAGELTRIIDAARAEDVHRRLGRRIITASDGMEFPAYAAGDPAAPPVVIAPATGMPVELSMPWITALATEFRVLTWETRGLFHERDGEWGVPEQVLDMVAVLDSFGVTEGHVFGMCSGAAVALAVAAECPGRVSSMSLWHGDFELGSAGPKTLHQRDLEALMTDVATGVITAESVHASLGQTLLATTPDDLAHLVLYPYASPGLLHRYCQTISAGMRTDVRGHLADIKAATLVVTSETDTTAHPEGSRYVAGELGEGTLHVLPEGDHLSLFRAGSALVSLAMEFIKKQLDRR
ncbi:hypothetical protein GCM10010191_87480 [Actinomadura vinacea]|uniref:Alpha/beta hydrolase n=1 Tax=Actinomadura vinacea TaxID=115336 RepID=A0ABN3KBE9_9ACTN